MNFQDILVDYNLEVIDHSRFVLNALLAALLSFILSAYYKKFGHAVANRSHFANNFMLLALTTMLIIYIVKSSIALSLGLVGALSIVRFRAAIKEPEELTYLFLVIGIGLGMGANQPIITMIAFVLILSLLYLQSHFKRRKGLDFSNQMVINISGKQLSEVIVNDLMKANFNNIELRRMSQEADIVYLTYVVEADNFDQLSETKKALLAKNEKVEFSFIDNKNSIS